MRLQSDVKSRWQHTHAQQIKSNVRLHPPKEEYLSCSNSGMHRHIRTPVTKMFEQWNNPSIMYKPQSCLTFLILKQGESRFYKNNQSFKIVTLISHLPNVRGKQLAHWKPVSSEISDLRNFWLHTMYACTD